MFRITLAAAAIALTGCGLVSSPGTAPPPSASAVTYDAATLSACKHAALSTSPDTDYETSVEEGRNARGSAAASDVDALREAVAGLDDNPLYSPLDNAEALTAAYAVSTWCIYHKLEG